MSKVSGQEARAARQYLKNIGYITDDRPMLWLNGTQLTGIAEQKRRERKMSGIQTAVDIDFMMRPPPSDIPSVRKTKGGKSRKRKRNRKKTRKHKYNKKGTKKRKHI